ncbi:putative lipoprotein [Escherichia fergusonii ATCC 35469]|uniref:Lipoprotein n=2 Tax=Escherichia fergusonii TaxID=564 RepID=B7LWI3_ESCF3|nr:DUF2291 domain-containing protein [Escherichia fergusonii]CAQ87902.1 putative lipoprotein [Escherichia fergusonii ATCC 35469]EHT2453657.1 DUF2291 domain-containing protein [Escherichia fergusonii]EIH2137468.1 DUF2291 domain-containing protein [Escherichia fergusonii]EIH2157013.1 DUF2291 domain-containing protein [Escherichia fergusonii]EIH9410397.1 DUF2291 domain-containing protein [Escherichia fergusonii]
MLDPDRAIDKNKRLAVDNQATNEQFSSHIVILSITLGRDNTPVPTVCEVNIMSGVSALASQHSRRRARRFTVIGIVIVAVFIAMAADTKVVKISEQQTEKEGIFSAEIYGDKTFPGVKSSIESRAVDATQLAEALKTNQPEAVKKYGVGSTLPVIPVRFEGLVGEGKSGIYNIHVEGFPEDVKLRLQTGPVLTGTELRDATGEIHFGDFTNQIEYQNAGAALNRTLKNTLLDKLDRETLPGKNITVVGVFRLLTPGNWLVVPVSLEAK